MPSSRQMQYCKPQRIIHGARANEAQRKDEESGEHTSQSGEVEIDNASAGIINASWSIESIELKDNSPQRRQERSRTTTQRRGRRETVWTSMGKTRATTRDERMEANRPRHVNREKSKSSWDDAGENDEQAQLSARRHI